MKKKIMLLAIISALCVSMTSCGMGDVNTNSDKEDNSKIESSIPSEIETNANPLDYENSEDGLIKYFKESGIIPNDANETARSYQYFDAIGGKAYTYVYDNSNITVEIYEMYSKDDDAAKLSEKAKSFIKSAKDTNSVTVLNQNVNAFVSNNDKFLVIYLSQQDDKNKQIEENFKSELDKFCEAQGNKNNNTNSKSETNTENSNADNTSSENKTEDNTTTSLTEE